MLHRNIIQRNQFMHDLMPTLIVYCPTVRRSDRDEILLLLCKSNLCFRGCEWRRPREQHAPRIWGGLSWTKSLSALFTRRKNHGVRVRNILVKDTF